LAIFGVNSFVALYNSRSKFLWLFFIVVVAAKLLYTTTTSRLLFGLFFVFGVWFGLLAGCAITRKQSKSGIFDLLIREGGVCAEGSRGSNIPFPLKLGYVKRFDVFCRRLLLKTARRNGLFHGSKRDKTLMLRLSLF
jgi:hypothetical protein